jgi:plasmid maintenance system antidote protein VapI
MNTKIFSQRFNRELAALDFPEDLAEKIKAVAKVFGVSRHMANAMIFGQLLPSDEQITIIAQELEVCPDWLKGISDKRKSTEHA